MTMTLIIIGVFYIIIGVLTYIVVEFTGFDVEVEILINKIKMHFMKEITEEEYNKLFK